MSPKTKILYIDDEVINTELFEINFSKDFEVLVGSNGTEGLTILEANTDITMVLSDMKMPGMNGLEFIAKAKQSYPDKTYFLVTGYDIIREIRQALKDNLIQRYFCKPLNADELRIALQEVVARPKDNQQQT